MFVVGITSFVLNRTTDSSSHELATISTAKSEATTEVKRKLTRQSADPAFRNEGITYPWKQSGEALRPAELYRKYLETARSGDADAQYILSTALLDCLNVPKTEEELDLDRLERLSLPPEFIETAKRRFHGCKPLHDALPDLGIEYEHWHSEAFNAGHPLTMLKQPDDTTENRKLRLRHAVFADYPEPHLYAEAFIATAEFYREDPAHRNTRREEAWSMLYCDASYACDPESEYRALRSRYHDHEYDEIVSIERDIREAILRNDPAGSGL